MLHVIQSCDSCDLDVCPCEPNVYWNHGIIKSKHLMYFLVSKANIVKDTKRNQNVRYLTIVNVEVLYQT